MSKTRYLNIDKIGKVKCRNGRNFTKIYTDYVGNYVPKYQDNTYEVEMWESRSKIGLSTVSSYPGRLKTNPYHLDKLKSHSPPGVVSKLTRSIDRSLKADGSFFSQTETIDDTSYWFDFRASYLAPHLPGPSFPGYYLGALKANKKIFEIDLNAAVAYAERRSTYNLIAQNAEKIAESLDHLGRGDNRQAALSLGLKPRKSKFKSSVLTLGPRWLELQYGWKPLLSDIHGALKLMHEKPPSWYVKSVTTTKQKVENSDYSGEVDTRVTFKALVTVTNPNLVAFNSTGILNPAVIAWELVPYSFVFDWFLPVGDYLSSFTARAGLSLTEKSSTYTTTERYDVHKRPSGVIPPDSYTESGSSRRRFSARTTNHGLASIGKLETKRKTRYLTFPDFPFPQLQSPVSLNHAITSVALLTAKRPAHLRT